ncbi:N-acetyltransferase family protein [Oceanobacillus kimchii]|uniref:GNAT family N-acetyltransferase n=1 Tax=Oceanobacillus kimchii TaxID=746691 RepID=UPI003B02A687
MQIRHIQSSDYYTISPLVNEWWGGREMSDMLPKLFFNHFNDTSFIVENDEEAVVGFLIGFLSQSKKNTAYIHFVGVHPDYRNQQVAKKLYNTFFKVIQQKGRNIVRSVTSPVNKGSIAFHKQMGFNIEEGDKEVEGIEVASNYDGHGQDRVLFMKRV